MKYCSLLLLLLSSCAIDPVINEKIVPIAISYETDQSSDVYVFIGRKLKVTFMTNEDTSIFASTDKKFFAQYEVIDNVYNVLETDTIEFIGFDHYGEPEFSRFENVLLYVIKKDSEYFHLKYQFNDVYRTIQGRWAGTFSSDYNHPYLVNAKIEPVKIEFENKIEYDLRFLSLSQIHEKYPSHHYLVDYINMKAIPITGNYVKDLFELKRKGVLKARGYFK
jgi:hypothetical protein